MDVETPCKPHPGRVRADGYGTIGSDLAHRRAWTEEIGPIPAGLELDHLCKRRDCVNVEHLEPVTRAENLARSDPGAPNRAKGECPRGHPYAGANLLVSGGSRLCRTCRNDASRERRKAERAARGCPRCGEPYDSVRLDGSAYCRPCTRENGRRAAAARWGA